MDVYDFWPEFDGEERCRPKTLNQKKRIASGPHIAILTALRHRTSNAFV
jgi:hypothetical protein